MNTAASIKTLCELKDITPELAKQIRHIWKHARSSEIADGLRNNGVSLHHGYVYNKNFARMLLINAIAGFHGVEFLGTNRHGSDIDFLNSGETYASTLFFVGQRMFVSTMGDLIEHGYVRKEHNKF